MNTVQRIAKNAEVLQQKITKLTVVCNNCNWWFE